MAVYYNENDPKAAAWLRELINQGHIAPGVVDERSITDVRAEDLSSFEQCHFFAGIGGWSYALRLAGWSDDKPVWTGSCPCQPFSTAGKGKGFQDERHLWPHFYRLINQCQPVAIFGEQVASNLAWLDLVSGDLETEGYAVGAAIIGAHSVGAPHVRQRLYWMADANVQRKTEPGHRETSGGQSADGAIGNRADGSELGNAESSNGGLSVLERGPQQDSSKSFGASETSQLEHSNYSGPQRRAEHRDSADKQSVGSASLACWRDCEYVPCTDGKSRPIEPGTFPLAHGIPERVGLLRGYGNAIVPQAAAAFIKASGLVDVQ